MLLLYNLYIQYPATPTVATAAVPKAIFLCAGNLFHHVDKEKSNQGDGTLGTAVLTLDIQKKLVKTAITAFLTF